MTARGEQAARTARGRREALFLLALVLVLAVWLEAVLLASPRPVPPGEGATWSTITERLYGRAARELCRFYQADPPARAALQRVVVLPPAGPVLRHYNVASPNTRGLAHYLREVATPEPFPPGWLREHTTEGRRARAGEAGLRLRFTSLETAGDRVSAMFAIDLERADQPPVTLAQDIRYEGSAVTLPWFVGQRGSLLFRLLLGALSVFLLLGGGGLGYIYYHLVEGRYVGPRDWAPTVNRLRAATGLMASSLILIAGFLLLVLTFLLAPSTGQALGVRRVHVDVLIDGDEFVLPSVPYRQPRHALAAGAAEIAAQTMATLEARDATEAETAEGALDWMRRRLPDFLRRVETTLRINRGASWRIFAASEGQLVGTGAEPQWPGIGPQERRDAVVAAQEAIQRRMPERGFGMPLPWSTNGLPPLDRATVNALGGAAGGEDGPGRRALLILSAFQAPDRPHYKDWLAACSNRPPGDRIYGVVMPGLARSANREWESYEGRTIAARLLCDRVVAAQQAPPEIATADEALVATAGPLAARAGADRHEPLFPFDGTGLKWFRNTAVPADLTRDAAQLFAAERMDPAAIPRIAQDFRDWFLAGRSFVDRTFVFTIPRQASYLLVLGLGLVFVVAGIRSEQNALGVPPWLPPLAVLVSGALLPALAGLWIHARHDTTRFVVYGFADLAFWGALFLWLCAGVVPVFLGRARAGLRGDRAMTGALAAALSLMAVAPLLHGAARTRLAQFALAAVLAAAGGTLLLALARRRGSAALVVALLFFLATGIAYLRFWGWAGQDLSAIGLLAVFLVMVASGWGSGLSWWQVTRHVDYDHIPWLRPLQRLLLALVLTLSGAATLYCSFPALQATGLIRGYVSYSITLAVLPYLLCALAVVAIDLLERDAR